jgi:hypothetical protein
MIRDRDFALMAKWQTQYIRNHIRLQTYKEDLVYAQRTHASERGVGVQVRVLVMAPF